MLLQESFGERELRHNLQLVKQYEIESIQQEVKRNEALWCMDTRRQNFRGSAHAATNAVLLFSRDPYAMSSKLDALDGEWRYGLSAPWLQRYPLLARFVLDFEKEVGGELGRVALVRLKKKALVYGHWFHLVIDSSNGSYMHIDDEQAVFQDGDLFFFGNKKWHTAYNSSDDWRVHLIIDIRLPKETSRSLPIYNYADWDKYSSIGGPDM